MVTRADPGATSIQWLAWPYAKSSSTSTPSIKTSNCLHARVGVQHLDPRPERTGLLGRGRRSPDRHEQQRRHHRGHQHQDAPGDAARSRSSRPVSHPAVTSMQRLSRTFDHRSVGSGFLAATAAACRQPASPAARRHDAELDDVVDQEAVARWVEDEQQRLLPARPERRLVDHGQGDDPSVVQHGDVAHGQESGALLFRARRRLLGQSRLRLLELALRRPAHRRRTG